MSSERAGIAARLSTPTTAPGDDGRIGTAAVLVDRLFGRVPAEDLAAYSAATLADLAASTLEHLRGPFDKGLPDIRFVDREIERNGRQRDVTIVKIVNDNMPFLLDSTLGEIVEQGYEPKFVAHPIVAVERNAAGELVRLVGEATALGPGEGKRESVIHIHLDRIDDEGARARLDQGLRQVHADVAVAVHDWDAMRQAVAATIAQYQTNPPPLPAD
ncbi:MAG TPA: NAD-glutamate dehydrogenase, partial [Beijerinckiaceae bacterium]|nr:NAD-glutamate dehydrogenase [Beijerinckiaceae bacterium]